MRALLVVTLFLAGGAAAGIGVASALWHNPKPPSVSSGPPPPAVRVTASGTSSQSAPSGSAAPTTRVAPASAAPKASAVPSVPALWQQTPAALAPFLTALAQPPTSASEPSAAAITQALTPLLAAPALNSDQVAVVVSDAATATLLFNRRGSDAVMPASTAKLAVAAAALRVLGPNRQLVTKVVQSATDPDDIVLVGGGDPTLAGPSAVGLADPGFPAPARLADLASRTAAALHAAGIARVDLAYDDSLFAGPTTATGWKPVYLTEGDVAPVMALEVDEGEPDLTKEARSADPAALAATDFAALLTSDGIDVDASPHSSAAAAGDVQLASVLSPPVSALVERMLERSDNDLAEALARQVAIASNEPATFAGGAAAVKAALAALGADVDGLAMVDGSGLSPVDRFEAVEMATLVRLAVTPGHPELAPLLAGLPVAGFSGTLGDRFVGEPGAGVVRAKTGTLDGVAALAGYVDDASGRVLVFSIVANGVALNATTVTDIALDHLASALAAE